MLVVQNNVKKQIQLNNFMDLVSLDFDNNLLIISPFDPLIYNPNLCNIILLNTDGELSVFCAINDPLGSSFAIPENADIFYVNLGELVI